MTDELKDLPFKDAEGLRDKAATRQLKAWGDKWSGNGEAWVNAAKSSATRNGIPMYYIFNQMKKENATGNPALKASDPHSSSIGVGQINQATAKHLGVNPLDPLQSIKGMGDYMGELKNKYGYNTFEDLSKAYTLGGAGYKKYQRGEHVAGADYIPKIDKFIAENNLGALNDLPTPEHPPGALNMNQGFNPLMTPQVNEETMEDPLERSLFFENPKRSLEEMALGQREQELSSERNKIINTPYHDIEDIHDLAVI